MLADKIDSSQKAMNSNERILVIKGRLLDGEEKSDWAIRFPVLEGTQSNSNNHDAFAQKCDRFEQNCTITREILENKFSEDQEPYSFDFGEINMASTEAQKREERGLGKITHRIRPVQIFGRKSDEPVREDNLRSTLSSNSADDIYSRADNFLDSQNVDIVIPGDENRPKKYVQVLSKCSSLEANQLNSDKSPLLSTVSASSLLLRRQNTPELKLKPSHPAFDISLQKTISLPLNLSHFKPFESCVFEKMKESEYEDEVKTGDDLVSMVDKMTNTKLLRSPTEISEKKSKHQLMSVQTVRTFSENGENFSQDPSSNL